MKKLKNLLMTGTVAVLALSTAACGGGGGNGGKNTTSVAPSDVMNIAEESAKYNGGDLLVRFVGSNGAEPISYNKATPLTLPDGSTLTSGQANLLPVWKKAASVINANIKDVAKLNTRPNIQIPLDANTNFTAGHIYGGNSVGEMLMEYGTYGNFVPINQYLDQMPDLKAYLDSQPNVKREITAADGNIYHLPYVAEIDNLARNFIIRGDWVEKLLDNPATVYNTNKQIDVVYQTFFDETTDARKMAGKIAKPNNQKSITKPSARVIDLQNAAAVSSKLNGQQACSTLKTYITNNYVNNSIYAKPSELYIGGNASYNADELVALFRCVKTNPGNLLGSDSAEVTVYFERKGSDRPNIFHLLNMFGVRAYGTDTYNGRWIFDADGKLQLAWTSKEFLDGMEILNHIYSEGLIMQGFDSNDNNDFRDTLYPQGNGFMTNDWLQSSLGYNLSDLNPNTLTDGQKKNLGLTAILPAVANINGNFEYFIENTRTIKPDGWAIATSAPKGAIAKALQLFNYFYTTEGRLLTNYGPQGITWDELDNKGVPVFNQWTLDNFGSSISDFLRLSIGAQLCIGYQKEIYFEWQMNNSVTNAAWEMYNNSNITTLSYSAENPLYRVGPTLFSLTQAENNQLKVITVGEMMGNNNDYYNVIKFGFGGRDKVTAWRSRAEFEAELTKKRLAQYVSIYVGAYERSMAAGAV